MANLTFPSNPTNGQKVTVNDKVFVYNSTTSRWTATRLQVLGNLTDDFTIDAPTLGVSLSTVSLSESNETVIITYTVDQDVKASISNNGIANTSVANVNLHTSNNTIVITGGTESFSNANIILTVTNTRTSNTATINLSASIVSAILTTEISSPDGVDGQSTTLDLGGDQEMGMDIAMTSGYIFARCSKGTIMNTAGSTITSGQSVWIYPRTSPTTVGSPKQAPIRVVQDQGGGARSLTAVDGGGQFYPSLASINQNAILIIRNAGDRDVIYERAGQNYPQEPLADGWGQNDIVVEGVSTFNGIPMDNRLIGDNEFTEFLAQQNFNNNKGRVLMQKKTASSTLSGYINPPSGDSVDGDLFGRGMSYDGKGTLLVASPGRHNADNYDIGRIYIYDVNLSSGNPSATLRATINPETDFVDPSPNSTINIPRNMNWGSLSAIDENTAVIAPGYLGPIVSKKLHIFTRSGNTWTNTQSLAHPEISDADWGNDNYDNWGVRIKLYGNVLIISSNQSSVDGNNGNVWIYKRTDESSDFELVKKITPPSNVLASAQFGGAIEYDAINKVLVVSAQRWTSTGGTGDQEGRLFLYELDGV